MDSLAVVDSQCRRRATLNSKLCNLHAYYIVMEKLLSTITAAQNCGQQYQLRSTCTILQQSIALKPHHCFTFLTNYASLNVSHW